MTKAGEQVVTGHNPGLGRGGETTNWLWTFRELRLGT
jgi:hypothetical protein